MASRESRPQRTSSVRGFGVAAAICLTTLMLSGCSGSESGTATIGTIDAGTVPTGSLPGPLTGFTDPPPPPTVPPEVPSLGDAPIAQVARNNRVLLIGDYVFESANNQNFACQMLNPQGWTIEVDSVDRATVGLGLEVVDHRANEGDFGVVGLMLGNNIVEGMDVPTFMAEYDKIIDAIGPRPIMVFTPTNNEASADYANAMRALPKQYPNVRVVDWGYVTSEKREQLLTDEIYPSTDGSNTLWSMALTALGPYGDAATAATASPGTTAVGDSTPAGTTAGTTVPGTTSPGTDGSGSTAPTTAQSITPGTAATADGTNGTECLAAAYTSATYTGSNVL